MNIQKLYLPPVILIILVLAIACSVLGTRSSVTDLGRDFDDFILQQADIRPVGAQRTSLRYGTPHLFAEYRADSLYTAEYARGNQRYGVEAISFASPKAAMGAFDVAVPSGLETVDIGSSGRREDSAVTCVKNTFIVTVIPRNNGNAEGARTLAEHIVGAIRGKLISPDPYEPLPTYNRVKNSEMYFMGPTAFSLRFTRELANAVAIGNSIEGVAARYSIDGGEVDFVKIRFPDTAISLETIDRFLQSRSRLPVIIPREDLAYHTVVHEDRRNDYIAEYGEWVFFMPDAPPGNEGRELFEYFLRGAE